MCRNFPEWLTADDRELTVNHALTEAGLHIEGGPQLWDLTTQKLVGDDGKQSQLELEPVIKEWSKGGFVKLAPC